MQSVKSPWHSTFDQFVGSIQESAIIAAPYISRLPVERLTQQLRSRRRSVRIDVLTSLRADSLVAGSVDAAALAWLCQRVPGAAVRHLRYLHAKAYVADGHTAIVTSANLTYGGLWRNQELGVAITEPDAVAAIADDLLEYGNIGVPVTVEALVELDGMAEQARQDKATMDAAVFGSVNDEYDDIVRNINERLVELRVSEKRFTTNPKASLNAQFVDAVKYVLHRNGPMKTGDMNPLIQQLLPELCDDAVDRVINGVTFGRKWKHSVRNAQLQLRRSGLLVQDEPGRNKPWRLIEGEQQ